MCKIRKAQSWSFDLIIAGIIFILVITIFYTLLVREPRADITQLKQEGNYIARVVAENNGNPCSFVHDKEVDTVKVRQCFETDAAEFKKENNIKGNFCIYFVDKEGRLITINDTVGWGDDDLYLNGTYPCGSKVEN